MLTETQQVEQLEKKGRDLFKTFFKNNTDVKILKEAQQRYTSWDVAMTSGSTKMMVEIKYRTCSSTQFPDFILENEKLNEMKNVVSAKTDVELIYCNIFSDNVIAMWNITNYQGNIEVKECTAKQYGASYKKNKQIFKLKLSDTFLKEQINEA